MTKILCIEDEAELRSDIVGNLKEAGYDMIEAENGRQGMDAIMKHEPDLVLCDVTMPEMSGAAVLREMRGKHQKFSDIPFLFLSALSSRDHIVKGLGLGADDYLTKPVDFLVLQSKIEAVLRQTSRINEKRDIEKREIFKYFSEKIKQLPASSRPVEITSQDRKPFSPKIDKWLGDWIGQDSDATAGCLRFIGVDKMKRKFGPRWGRLSKKVMLIADDVIRHHLSSKDVYEQVAGGVGFMILFHGLTKNDAATKIKHIQNELETKLLGDDALACKDHLNTQILGTLRGLAEKGGAPTAEDLSEKIEQAYHQVDASSNEQIIDTPVDGRHAFLNQVSVKFIPTWHSSEHIIVSHHGQPHRNTGYGEFSGESILHGGSRDPMMIDLDIFLTKQVILCVNAMKDLEKRTCIGLPLHIPTLFGEQRDRLISAFDKAPRHQLTSFLNVEILADDEVLNESRVYEGVSFLKQYCRSVSIRISPHNKYARAFKLSGVDFMGFDLFECARHLSESGRVKVIEDFSRGYAQHDILSYVFGLSTVQEVKAAMNSGLTILGGNIIAPETAKPNQTVHIPPKQILGL